MWCRTVSAFQFIYCTPSYSCCKLVKVKGRERGCVYQTNDTVPDFLIVFLKCQRIANFKVT